MIIHRLNTKYCFLRSKKIYSSFDQGFKNYLMNHSTSFRYYHSLKTYDNTNIDLKIQATFFNTIGLNYNISYILDPKKKHSLAILYAIFCKNKPDNMDAYELSRFYKRMYILMLKYLAFSRFCNITNKMLHEILPQQLLSKINLILLNEDININHSVSSSKTFLQFLNKLSKDLIKMVNSYTEDIFDLINELRYPGISETVFERMYNVHAHTIFFHGYKEPLKDKKWYDRDYLAVLTASYVLHPDKLTSRFDELQHRQLTTYLKDLFNLLRLIYIPLKLHQITVGKHPDIYKNASVIHLFKIFNYKNIINTNFINLTEFDTEKPLSNTQFKSLLTALEHTLIHMNVVLVKTLTGTLDDLTEETNYDIIHRPTPKNLLISSSPKTLTEEIKKE